MSTENPQHQSKHQLEPVAIVGMACRFPGGANSPKAYWDILMQERNVRSVIPAERFDIDEYYDPDMDALDRIYTRHAHFVENPSCTAFDAPFFKIGEREAAVLDPMQRMLLEVSWSAFEDAGIAPTSLRGTNTGVFVGLCDAHHLVDHKIDDHRDYVFYLATAGATSVAAGRLSYFLDLHGPNLAIDTACSSSLVGIHQACINLRMGECDLAIAGGVNAINSYTFFYALAKGKMLAPDGMCKTFSDDADGYGRGEGCGMIVLKRLSDAQRDGNRILAVIRASNINHDGRTTGITAPNGDAQIRVINGALDKACVDAADIHYVEAHGTGTTLGDAVELQSLATVFHKHTLDNPLRVGSAKTVIGHLEAGAGIAGVIKTVLAMQHEMLPKHLNVTTLNSRVDWETTPLRVTLEKEAWPASEQGRLAGVSSFGFSGTNAHIVMESAERYAASASDVAADRPQHILALSAYNTDALRDMQDIYRQRLSEPGASLADVAFSTNTGRTHLRNRLVVVATDAAQAKQALDDHLNDSYTPAVITAPPATHAPQIGFLCTGQGSQYPDMGRGLYETLPGFRAHMDCCSEILEPVLKRSLIDIIYHTEADRASHPINQTVYTQPSLFALESGLAHLLRDWGVQPTAVLGHSLGESTAAYLAGVISLEDGLYMTAERGLQMQALPSTGGMAAVRASANWLQSLIDEYAGDATVVISNYNGPESNVISGDKDAVMRLAEIINAQGVKATPLHVSQAFHSPLVSPMSIPFEEFVARLDLNTPGLPVFSTVLGELIEGRMADPGYWGDGIRKPVRYQQALNAMYQSGVRAFVEIGPHPVLTNMGRACLPEDANLLWLPLLRRKQEDWPVLLETLSTLYVNGLDVDWQGFDAEYREGRRKVSIPTYPFQRKVYWPKGIRIRDESIEGAAKIDTGHPLLGGQLEVAGEKQVIYEQVLTHDKPKWIPDHGFHGAVIFPGAGYVELALAAGERFFGTQHLEIRDMHIPNAMVIPDEGVVMQTAVRDLEDGQLAFEVHGHIQTDDESDWVWTEHARAVIAPLTEQAASESFVSHQMDIVDKASDDQVQIDRSCFYESLFLPGLHYGETFKTVDNFHYLSERTVTAALKVAVTDAEKYIMHPAFIDGALQLQGWSLPILPLFHNYLPVRLQRIRFNGNSITEGMCVNRYWEVNPSEGTYDTHIAYLDKDGQVVLEIDGGRFRGSGEEATSSNDAWRWRDNLYETTWQPVETLPDDAKVLTWVLLHHDDALAQDLTDVLSTAGHTVIAHRLDGEAHTPSEIAADLSQFDDGPWGILYLPAVAGAGERVTVLDSNTLALLKLTQALIALESQTMSSLTILSRNAVEATGEDVISGLESSALWGMARTIRQEQPALSCVTIDVDGSAPALSRLPSLLGSHMEPEIVLRKDAMYVPRMHPLTESDQLSSNDDHLTIPRGQAYRLTLTKRGSLDTLQLVPTRRVDPTGSEVEIKVYATGLNFIDVLDTLGMLPFERESLGGECAGIITQVGPDVTEFEVGDAVFAYSEDCFGRYNIARQEFVAMKPDNISFEQAATLPIVYLTAYFSLVEHAKIKAGDKVLIHAASGGVGFAAIQLAQRVGAEIYATASTPKWDYVRSLGVSKIYNSRILDFASEIMSDTDGAGVDVVLNSLAGDFLARSVDILAPDGRFIEIGKRGVWSQQDFSAKQPGAYYTIYDLITHAIAEPEQVSTALRQISTWIADGELEPLPVRTWPLEQVREAFRTMQLAQHTGKIVVTQSQADSILRMDQIKSDAIYMITGGWGALGMRLARSLAYKGARHIALIGRSQPKGAALDTIRALERMHVTVYLIKADMSERASLERAFKKVTSYGPPIKGIFHAAGVLDDHLISDISSESLTKVMGVKAHGAWYLHELSRDIDLEFFQMFSSVSATLGSMGQANYAAANAYLDALAYHRQKLDLPGQAISWGAWSGGGMATRTGTDVIPEETGIRALDPLDGTRAMQYFIVNDVPHATVIDVDWTVMAANLSPVPPFLADLVSADAENSERSTVLDDIRAVLPTMQRDKTGEYVRSVVARILRLPASTPIGDGDTFADFGMDSLMTVELRNAIQSDLKHALPATLTLRYPTLGELVDYLVEILELGVGEGASEQKSQAEPEKNGDLDTLSDDELEQRLTAKLDSLEDV